MITAFYMKLKSLENAGDVKRITLTADGDDLTATKSTQAHNLPALYLYPISHTADAPSDRPNYSTQQITQTIGITMAIKDISVRTKNRPSDFDKVLGKMKNTLFGWQPPHAFGAVSYAGADLLGVANGVMFFETRWTITEQWQG